MGKLALVTGGAGFVGSHVARYCLNLGYEVIVLDDLSGGYRDQVPTGATFEQGSTTDRDLVRQLFDKYQPDYVYHLAAYAAEGLSHYIRCFNYENNLLGSAVLINESIRHDVRCFVFVSSIAVYGANQLPMTEDMVPQPEDPYGISKYAIELDLRAAYQMFGLNYIIFRAHNIYGPYQSIGDQYRNVVGVFMNRLLQDKPLIVFGDGLQTRPFTYIDDVAPYIVNSVDVSRAYGETINVGSDQSYTVMHLAEVVAGAFGVAPQIQYVPARREVKHTCADHSKARRILGWQPTIGLEEGVDRMAQWARKVGARGSRAFYHIELPDQLPEVWKGLGHG